MTTPNGFGLTPFGLTPFGASVPSEGPSVTSGFPENFSRVWVRGQIVELGKLASGESAVGLVRPVKFTPSPTVLLDPGTRQIIKTDPFTVTPAAINGYFQLYLPVTNDPDIIPMDWTYAVEEPTGRKYNIRVDINTPILDSPGDSLHGQQVIDLVTVIPAPGASAGIVQLVGGAISNLYDVVLPDPIPGGSVLVYDAERNIWVAQILDLEDDDTAPITFNFPVGPTESRPSPTVPGRVFYDTTLNLPIIGDGANWRKFDGAILGAGGGGGGSTSAPQNFRVTTDTVNRTFLCEWDPVSGADFYTLYEDRSPTGVSGATALTTTSSLRGPFSSTNTQTFNYWVTANKAGVESPISNKAGGSFTGGGGGGGGTTPGSILNIANGTNGKNHFNVGIGYSSGHTDKSPQLIADGFQDSPYFTVNGTKVQFQVFANGGTTSSGTKYARSELREMEQNGIDRAAWNGSSGTHWMEGKSTITYLPPAKSWVCFTQVHDASSDLARVQIEGTAGNLKIVLRNTPPGSSTETTTTIASSYTLGTELSWKWEIINGTGKFYLNGVMVKQFPAGTSGCYFKTGCYLQANSSQVAASEYGIVLLRDLKHWHTGWPTPGGTSSAGFGTAPFGTAPFGSGN